MLAIAICLFLGHLTFSQANNTEVQRTVTLTIGAQGKTLYSIDKISQISKYTVSKLDFSYPVLSFLLKHNSNMRMINDKF